MEDYEPDIDESYEIESALGSAGMGTDEYYEHGNVDMDSWLTDTDLPGAE